jgi:hypothetical protein
MRSFFELLDPLMDVFSKFFEIDTELASLSLAALINITGFNKVFTKIKEF